MTRTYTRRGAIITAAAAFLGGCLSRGEEDDPAAGADDGGDTPTVRPTPTPDEGETTPTEDGSETEEDEGSEDGEESPEEQVARLPDQHPLADELVDLILAEDREAFAEERDLTLRNGRVQVDIRLVEGGDPPEEYLPEDRSAYGDKVIAYVDIDDLVDLALHDDVRRVTRRFEPKTD